MLFNLNVLKYYVVVCLMRARALNTNPSNGSKTFEKEYIYNWRAGLQSERKSDVIIFTSKS
jgi:hypothetical protein